MDPQHAIVPAPLPDHLELRADLAPTARWALTIHVEHHAQGKLAKDSFWVLVAFSILLAALSVVAVVMMFSGAVPLTLLPIIIFGLAITAYATRLIHRRTLPCHLIATQDELHIHHSEAPNHKPHKRLPWAQLSHFSAAQHQQHKYLIAHTYDGTPHFIAPVELAQAPYLIDRLNKTKREHTSSPQAPPSPSSQLVIQDEPGRTVLDIYPKHRDLQRAGFALSLIAALVSGGLLLSKQLGYAIPAPWLPYIVLMFSLFKLPALFQRLSHQRLTRFNGGQIRLERCSPWGTQRILDQPAHTLTLERSVPVALIAQDQSKHTLAPTLPFEALVTIDQLLHDYKTPSSQTLTTTADTALSAPAVRPSGLTSALRRFTGFGWRVKIKPSTPAPPTHSDAPIQIATASVAHYSMLYLVSMTRTLSIYPDKPHIIIMRSDVSQQNTLLTLLDDGLLLATGPALNRTQASDLHGERFIFNPCEQPLPAAIASHQARLAQLMAQRGAHPCQMTEPAQLERAYRTLLLNESAKDAQRFAMTVISLLLTIIGFIITLLQ